jgi:hypothetical protein
MELKGVLNAHRIEEAAATYAVNMGWTRTTMPTNLPAWCAK